MSLDPWLQRLPEYAARKHYFNPRVSDSSKEDILYESDMQDGNLISSECVFDDNIHLPLFDLDGVDISLLPSVTPGNHHLYINHPIPWDKYSNLLRAMADCGIADPRWVEYCLARKSALLRHPKEEKDEGHYRNRNY
jgi:hypothetical protein